MKSPSLGEVPHMSGVDDIRRAMAAFQRQAMMPDYILLTYDEWLAVKNDRSVMTALNLDSGGPDRIYGIPIVLEGTDEHERMQMRGKRPLRLREKGPVK